MYTIQTCFGDEPFRDCPLMGNFSTLKAAENELYFWPEENSMDDQARIIDKKTGKVIKKVIGQKEI